MPPAAQPRRRQHPALWRYLLVPLILLASVWPGRPAHAQTGTDVPLRAEYPGLPATLADTTARQIAARPGRFVEDMVTLIMAHGSGDRIDAQGLQDAVGVARARTRARELHRFAVADLDGDGDVTPREVDTAIAANAARSKARLTLGHRAADTDGDGVARADEIARFAEATALAEMSAEKADRFAAFMSMDVDGDAFVSVSEVIAAVAAVQAAIGADETLSRAAGPASEL